MDAKQLNEDLNKLRKERINILTSKMTSWNPEKDDIKELVLTIEELRGVPKSFEKNRNCYKALKKVKSSRVQKEKLKIIKDFMKKTGDGDFFVVDKNGFCLTDINYGSPFVDHGERGAVIEHIDEIISDNVAEAEDWEKHQFDDDC